jgi:hypothetical protein
MPPNTAILSHSQSIPIHDGTTARGDNQGKVALRSASDVTGALRGFVHRSPGQRGSGDLWRPVEVVLALGNRRQRAQEGEKVLGRDRGTHQRAWTRLRAGSASRSRRRRDGQVGWMGRPGPQPQADIPNTGSTANRMSPKPLDQWAKNPTGVSLRLWAFCTAN